MISQTMVLPSIHYKSTLEARPPLRLIHSLSNIPHQPASKPNLPRPVITRAATDENENLSTSVPIPPLDPSRHDVSASFIRFPFKQHVDWYTLAEHPNWFLDPNDFNYTGAPLYPSDLEPPRGWGPPKTRRGLDFEELDKEKEEHRLRCTFCRRTYGGVNAKSMWRRHVFDKHRVAMRNRRDNTERPKGRTKENKRPTVDPHYQYINNTDRVAKLDETYPAQLPQNTAARHSERKGSATQSLPLNLTPPSTPRIPQLPFTPLNAQVQTLSAYGMHGFDSSPYDPTRTPQFIHTKPRHPVDHALRFHNSPGTAAAALSADELDPEDVSLSNPVSPTQLQPNFIEDSSAAERWITSVCSAVETPYNDVYSSDLSFSLTDSSGEFSMIGDDDSPINILRHQEHEAINSGNNYESMIRQFIDLEAEDEHVEPGRLLLPLSASEYRLHSPTLYGLGITL